MKKLIRLLAAVLVVLASPALGATRGGAPAKFSIPFANSAGGAFITYPLPTNSQIGIKCGAASLTDGFPPLTMQPISSGGCPPLGQDFNGAMKQMTQWNQQTAMGALPIFDASFAASINGYPEGALLSQSAIPSCLWINQVDNNSANPDTGGANWISACPGGGVGTATSTGSANAQVVVTTPINIQNGVVISFVAGFTNNAGSMTFTVNGSSGSVAKNVPGGTTTTMGGGEVQVGQQVYAVWTGSAWILLSGPFALLTVPDQTLSGGANVTSLNLGSGSGGGTVTLDCGARPLQFITNAGAFTIAAPANDGSCIVLITNSGSAGTISFSGFTVNTGAGAVLDTTNGHKFTLSIWRINGTAGYQATAMQ